MPTQAAIISEAEASAAAAALQYAMTSEGHGVAFDVGVTTTLPSMGHSDWLGFSGDFSSFGAPFPGGYSFESKAFSAFPPLQSQQAVPVNVNRAEVDSTGDSKGPPTPASAVSGTSQGDERADSSPTSNGNAGYRPWGQVAESFTEEKSPPTKSAANATSSTEAFHNGSTPSDDSTSSTQASADQRPPSAFKASNSQTPSPFGSDGNFRSATAEADTTTTELRPVVPDFQVAAVTSSTPLSRPPSQMHALAALEPLQPLQPLPAIPPQLQVPVTMAMQGQSWSQELASPQAVPIQLGQIPGQHLLLQHPQQHSPVPNLNQPGQITPIGRQLSTPPTPTQMVPPSSSPGVTEVSGSLERQQQKKKRKRCGECPGCLKKDNCGECGPCRSVRSHQICKMRRCDTLVKTKKDKAPAQPRQKKTDGTKAKGNAKNARANGQDASMGTTVSPVNNGNPAKRHRASPDENKNLHQLTTDIKTQFGLIGTTPNGMYVHHDSSMPPPHMAGYSAGVPTTTFAPGSQTLFSDPNQYAPAPAYGPPPTHAMAGHATAPMALPAYQQNDEFNQHRHQLMNSRLKSLIQSRASLKEPEQNSQDGFRSPAPNTPTGTGSPTEFYVSQPEWGASNGQQGQHTAATASTLNPSIKLEVTDPGQEPAPTTNGSPQSSQAEYASPGQQKTSDVERPPSNQSVGRQTPQNAYQSSTQSFGSPKTAFQTPNGFQGHAAQDRPVVSSAAQQTFLLNSTAPVVSYPNIVTYSTPGTAYDPQATVGFPPKTSFYQGAQFSTLTPPAPDMNAGSLYATNGFASGPLPSMGSGFGALPPMHAAGPQASALNLPGTDPWWDRLERLKAHGQADAEGEQRQTEYSSAPGPPM